MFLYQQADRKNSEKYHVSGAPPVAAATTAAAAPAAGSKPLIAARQKGHRGIPLLCVTSLIAQRTAGCKRLSGHVHKTRSHPRVRQAICGRQFSPHRAWAQSAITVPTRRSRQIPHATSEAETRGPRWPAASCGDAGGGDAAGSATWRATPSLETMSTDGRGPVMRLAGLAASLAPADERGVGPEEPPTATRLFPLPLTENPARVAAPGKEHVIKKRASGNRAKGAGSATAPGALPSLWRNLARGPAIGLLPPRLASISTVDITDSAARAESSSKEPNAEFISVLGMAGIPGPATDAASEADSGASAGELLALTGRLDKLEGRRLWWLPAPPSRRAARCLPIALLEREGWSSAISRRAFISLPQCWRIWTRVASMSIDVLRGNSSDISWANVAGLDPSSGGGGSSSKTASREDTGQKSRRSPEGPGERSVCDSELASSRDVLPEDVDSDTPRGPTAVLVDDRVAHLVQEAGGHVMPLPKSHLLGPERARRMDDQTPCSLGGWRRAHVPPARHPREFLVVPLAA